MFNPFSQCAYIVGACDWNVTINQSTLLNELIEKHDVQPQFEAWDGSMHHTQAGADTKNQV